MLNISKDKRRIVDLKSYTLQNTIYKVLQVVVSISSFVGVVLFLKYIHWDIGIRFSYVPDVQTIVSELLDIITQVEFYNNIIISLGRVYCGFLLAAVIAIPTAVFIVENSKIKYLLHPIIELIRPIPNVAWVPLSIILFKSVSGSILFITFIGAFFPILINSIEGLEHVNTNYIKIAKSFKVSTKEMVLGVKLPAAASNIFTGLLVGMSGSWLGVVVAEMIGGQSGIGYLTWVNYTMVNMSGVIVCMFVIGALGAMSSWILRKLYKMLHFEMRTEL